MILKSFGRSTFNHFNPFHSYFALPRSMLYHPLLPQIRLCTVLWFLRMEDLFESFTLYDAILSMIVVTDFANTKSPNTNFCRFGRSIILNSSSQLYLEAQRNNNENCMIHFQLTQFEWIVIVVNSSIQIHLQNR